MRLPEYTMTITEASVEQRSFRDRATGQERNYTAVCLAGFSVEQSALFVLSCRESLAPVVSSLKVGDKVRFSLRSFEAKNGLIEGTVGEVLK